MKIPKAITDLPIFQTSDLYIASLLLALKFTFVSVKREGNRVLFIFQDRPDREQLISDYYNSKLSLNAIEFVGAIKECKGLLRNV